MTITAPMKAYLGQQVYTRLSKVAEEITDGTWRDIDKGDELAARVACWVASEARNWVDVEDEGDWPMIATMADLVAIAMLAQHDADRAMLRTERICRA